MKVILFPTDFSKNADNALNYAIAIAKNEKAKLLLVHAFHINYVASTSPAHFIEAEIDKAQREANHHLHVKCEAIYKSEKIESNYISRMGLADDVILDTIKEKKPDLVIMGTQGASGLKGVLLGSNTAKVIGKAKCPVIAIPANAKYHEIKKIVYTTDFHESDILSLKKLIKLMEPFKAHINVIHIYDGQFVEGQKSLLLKFKEKIEKKIKYTNISYHLVQGKDTKEELERISKSKSNDLLVMSTHQRFLIDLLLNRSLTKNIASHTKVPLMTFRHKEDLIVVI